MGHHLADSSHSQVAIIGGGYAGIAAAIRLAEHGIQSTLFEAGKELGGRARRIRYQGQTLDNGQHILSGAYTELLRMMRLVGVPDRAYRRIPLTLAMPPDFTLAALRLPAPLHLAQALLFAQGLTWADRWAAIRLIQKLKHLRFRLPTNQTVHNLLHEQGQTETVINHLWQPLCISALNTPLETASAQIFANVLRDALLANRAASDLLLPQTDLSALFPEPAEAWLQARGNSIHRATPVVALTKEENHFTITTLRAQHTAQAVIVAVGPHQLDALSLPAAAMPAHTWQYEPIYTLYLQYPCAVTLPNMMTGQVPQKGLIQWFFNRELLSPSAADVKGLIAAVISASGPHQQM
ncbi:MAG: FAD-dependent oxidoreductase, partial [Betaproteobacteria bacterium]|nr:FAD-dependent oxidoreductase [Betaproteobacteria bacterium]